MPRKKRKQPVEKPVLSVSVLSRPRRYRLLVRLPMTVSLSVPEVFRLGSDKYPEFSIGPIHEEAADQIEDAEPETTSPHTSRFSRTVHTGRSPRTNRDESPRDL